MTPLRLAAAMLALAGLACGPAGMAGEPAAPPQPRAATEQVPETTRPSAIPASPASPELHRVRQVIDGDTITVADIGTIRLIGVDAPEKQGGFREAEPYGDQATAYLRKLADGQLVRLEYDGERKDRFNRTLAYVFLEDGTLVNEAIIRAGWAEHYRSFDYHRKADFRQAEREARAASRGMWRR
ncbi:MAG: thermonuclease family protein [Acidobacteria bacterium]|nr:thermonuclease family protein [Acidobacteriota bacterium]